MSRIKCEILNNPCDTSQIRDMGPDMHVTEGLCAECVAVKRRAQELRLGKQIEIRRGGLLGLSSIVAKGYVAGERKPFIVVNEGKVKIL